MKRKHRAPTIAVIGPSSVARSGDMPWTAHGSRGDQLLFYATARNHQLIFGRSNPW